MTVSLISSTVPREIAACHVDSVTKINMMKSVPKPRISNHQDLAASPGQQVKPKPLKMANPLPSQPV